MSQSPRPRPRPRGRVRGTYLRRSGRAFLALVVLATGFALLGASGPVQAAPATLSATPNPVVIPLGQNGSSYQYSWNTGSTANARITVSIDNGAPVVVASSAAPAGTATGLITYGTTQTLRLYPANAPTRLLATLTVTTRRPDASCAGTCIKSVKVDPHGTYAGFEVIATAQLKTFELTALLDGQPVAGMVGANVSTWNTFLVHVKPATAYEYVLKVTDEAGNSQTLTGNFTTRKRLVTVTFGELEVIDDADGINGDGDLVIWYDADTWSSVIDEYTLGTGDTFILNRQFQVIGAPDTMVVGIDIADQDCWGTQLCDEGLGTVRGDDSITGDGHECWDSFEQNAASRWRTILTLQSGFGEEFAGDVVLKTTSCELQYRVEVHYEVTYI